MSLFSEITSFLKKQLARFSSTGENYPDAEWLPFVFRIIALLVLYVILDNVLNMVTNLPESAYYSSVIFIGFLKRLFTTKYAILLIPLIIFGFVYRKHLLISWSDFYHGKAMRFLVLLAAILLAWTYSTYNFNHYYNQAFIVDRILLVVMLPFIYKKPVFIFPFLAILLPVIWQFDTLSGFSWAAPYLPIRIIILFGAFYLFRIVTKDAHVSDFVFLAGCLFVVHYWTSGSGKLDAEWILHDNVSYLLPATHANGWLGGLSHETIGKFTSLIGLFNIPVKMITLFAEVGSILFFFHRRLARIFLVGWILMHTGIFLVSGICFWMWLVLDAGFLYLLWRKDGISTLPIFNRPQLFVAAVLVIGGAYWCRPVKLSWHDVPVSYTYRFQGHTGSGKVVNLPPAWFAPYDYQFTLSGFAYLDPNPNLGITWGAASDPNLPKELEKLESPEAFFAYEAANGLIHYNGKRSEVFDIFMKQYIQNRNSRLTKKTCPLWLKAPRLLWTFPVKPDYDIPEPIDRVTVVQVVSSYADGVYSEIRERPVREIQIK